MTELDDWQILLGLFPSEWRQLGRSSGAVRRLRGFPSLDAMLRTLLLHVGCGWSLRETSVQAKLAGIADVSDVTLLNRLRDAENWLRLMCQELWKENGVELQPSFGGRMVRLVDATVVREPGKTGSQWRIHYSLRLPTLECDHFHLTSTRGTGAGERFGRFRFQAVPGPGIRSRERERRPNHRTGRAPERCGRRRTCCQDQNARGRLPPRRRHDRRL